MRKRTLGRLLLAGVVLTALSLLAQGCPGQRRSLSREALMRGLVELPRPRAEPVMTLEDVARLRVPPPAAAPPALVEAAERWTTLPPLEGARVAVALLGDLALAERAWAQLGDDADALLHRCLVEQAYERGGARAACSRFLDVAAGDPRAPAVLATLSRGRELDPAIDDVVLTHADRWIAACRAAAPAQGCADLAQLSTQAARRAASRAKDEKRAMAAATSSGVLAKARVEGPFVGDPLYAFATAGAGRTLPRAPQYQEVTRAPWDGVYQPALRQEGGLYRLVAHVEGSGAVNVTVRSRSSLRLYVDGLLVSERRPELREEPDASRARLVLSPGAHLLEALVVSYGGADGVELSFLDDEGRAALRVVEASGGGQGKATRTAPRALVPEPKSLDPLARLDTMLLRHHLGAIGYGISAGSHLEDGRALVRELGFAPQALVAGAEALSRAPRLPEHIAAADAARLWRRLLQVWPDHPSALESRAAMLREERPLEALAVYRELAKARPEHPAGHAGVAELALSLGLLDEALAAARTLTQLDPLPFDLRPAGSVFVRLGRKKDAARIDAHATLHEDALFGSHRARRLLEEGRREQALSELTRLLAREPGHPSTELAWDLLELEGLQPALRSVEEHLSSFPFDRSAWRRRVALSAAVHGPEAGREVARRALSSLGADPQLWLASVELGGLAPWSERLAAGDEAVSALWQTSPAAFPGHSVVLVMDHEETHLFDDLSSLSLRHWIVRLGSKDALDAFGELSLGRDQRVVRLRVVKPDGSERLPELRDGVEDVSLTGLAVGDVVELLTASFADAPLVPGFSQEVVAFQKPAPALVRSYELAVPMHLLDEGLVVFARNGAPPPQVVRNDDTGRARVSFVARNVPSLLTEPNAPADAEAAPVVGWSFGRGEEEWRVLRGSATLRAAASDPFLERVAEAVAGSGAPRERWQRLFRFVVTRIEPAEQPSDALAVLASGRGQRTALLMALAAAAHLDARPAALHLPASPPLKTPSDSAWPVLAVAVDLGERTSFALVDDGLAVLDELPASARGSAVLDLALRPREGGLVVDEVAFSTMPVRVQLDLDYQDDGFSGFFALTVPAVDADRYRRWIRASSRKELAAAFEHALASTLPGVTVLDVSLPNLEAFGRPLGVGVALELAVSREGGEQVRFDHLFADGAASSLGLFPALSSYLSVSERKRPLLLKSAHEVLQVEVTLPQGATFTEVPERTDEDLGPIRLTQRAEVTDGTLAWTREIVVDTARVAPADWPRFRERLSALARRTDARLAFLLQTQPKS